MKNFIDSFKLTFPLKITLALIPITLAFAFIFLNIQESIKNFYNWFKSRNATTMSKNMIKFLGIKDIKEGIIQTKDNINPKRRTKTLKNPFFQTIL